MRKLLLGTIAFAAAVAAGAVGAARAADMPPVYKAPPPVIAYGWSGVYIGANVGLSVGRDRSETREFAVVPGILGPNEKFVLSPFGVIGGAQIGVNWQIAPSWVIGLEADFQASEQRDDNCLFFCNGNPGDGTRVNQRIEWFGTARARAGWTNGPALFYLTGGYAYGRVATDHSRTFFGTAAASFSDDRSGWTAGTGIEAQLAGNWSGRVEYLYVDLGTVSGDYVSPSGFLLLGYSSRVRDHVFRAGVNYKFGDPIYVAAAPRGVYKAAPPPVVAYNWSGVYVGGNLGLSVARNATSNPVAIVAGGTASDQFTLSPVGAIGGGGIGVNWQVSPSVVWGLEADFQWSGQRDSTTCNFDCVEGLPEPFVNVFQKISQRMPWFGTVRARAGWSTGPALFYITGGYAYGRVETDVAAQESLGPALLLSTGSGSFAANRSGWTAGAGLEAQIIGNWTGKIEYLYLDLGTTSGSYTIIGDPLAGTSSFDIRLRDHIFRAGVNYKLDWGPVVARY